MDTRFWGPSGWKLLHLITFTYEPKKRDYMRNFLETIPYILPCKFCRASLTDYYRELPYERELISKESLTKWLYNIHNCVNDKLRKQGLNPSPDPEFKDIKEFYEKWKKCNSEQHLSTFWDFLFSVAYNHPKESSKKSSPMPECPKEVYTCNDDCEKNKWNILNLKQRIEWYKKFWMLLPVVLPDTIKVQWESVEKENIPTLESRKSTIAWLWRMRCALDTNFKDPYTHICKKISMYSSDCGSNKKAYTCRKKKWKTKKISKTLRK